MKKSVSVLWIKLCLKGLTGYLRQRQILTCGTCRCYLRLLLHIPCERKGGEEVIPPLYSQEYDKKNPKQPQTHQNNYNGKRNCKNSYSSWWADTPKFAYRKQCPWELCNLSAFLRLMSCANLWLKEGFLDGKNKLTTARAWGWGLGGQDFADSPPYV